MFQIRWALKTCQVSDRVFLYQCGWESTKLGYNLRLKKANSHRRRPGIEPAEGPASTAALHEMTAASVDPLMFNKHPRLSQRHVTTIFGTRNNSPACDSISTHRSLVRRDELHCSSAIGWLQVSFAPVYKKGNRVAILLKKVYPGGWRYGMFMSAVKYSDRPSCRRCNRFGAAHCVHKTTIDLLVFQPLRRINACTLMY